MQALLGIKFACAVVAVWTKVNMPLGTYGPERPVAEVLSCNERLDDENS